MSAYKSLCEKLKYDFDISISPPYGECKKLKKIPVRLNVEKVRDRKIQIEDKFESLIFTENSEIKENESAIYEWMPQPNIHNFGDYLMHLIGERLFTCESWTKLNADRNRSYILLGSAICNEVIEKIISKNRTPVFVCCGYRGVSISKDLVDLSIIHGCRGFLTQNMLKHVGVFEQYTGDPAIIIPLLINKTKKSGKRLLIPHINDPKKYYYDPANFDCDEIIYPDTKDIQSLKFIISELSSAEIVLAGAMHAAVVAYAYNVPFAFFEDGFIDCPDKWKDWVSSIGLPINNIAYCRSAIIGQQWYANNKKYLTKPKYTNIIDAYRCIGDVRCDVRLKALIHDYN